MHGVQGVMVHDHSHELTAEHEDSEKSQDKAKMQSLRRLSNLSWLSDEEDDALGTGLSMHHWLLDSVGFKIAVMTCVALNTIQMGIEADYPDEKTLWRVCENFFTAAFAIEMCLKLYILRCHYFRDKANWLDLFVTLAAVLDTWVLSFLGGEDGVDLQSLSVLRVFRLIRLLRVIKLAKHSKKVVLVLQGLFAALQVTFFVSCLLGLSIYACSIFCVEMIGRQTMYPGYTEVPVEINEQEIMTEFNPFLSFGSMGKAMVTLFSIAIFAEWTEVVRPVYLKQPGMVLFFVFFALVVCFGVMNVIIGMIVESVMSYSNQIAHKESVRRKDHILVKMGRISQLIEAQELSNYMALKDEEVDACFSDTDMKELMKEIELPLGFSGKQMLAMLDDDGDGSLGNNKFMGSFERIIHSGPFQQACMFQAGINEVKYLIRKNAARTEKRLNALEAKISVHLGETPQPPKRISSSDALQEATLSQESKEVKKPRSQRPMMQNVPTLEELNLPGMVPSKAVDHGGSAEQVIGQALPPQLVEGLFACVVEAVQTSLRTELSSDRWKAQYTSPDSQGSSCRAAEEPWRHQSRESGRSVDREQLLKPEATVPKVEKASNDEKVSVETAASSSHPPNRQPPVAEADRIDKKEERNGGGEESVDEINGLLQWVNS
mmetsp:Transcript_74070/g.176389  ORF Transcript_74070/g.176389 Transcript_74070/m.176389 type:complete len:660 (-) Transcript_74070:83-2062(-)